MKPIILLIFSFLDKECKVCLAHTGSYYLLCVLDPASNQQCACSQINPAGLRVILTADAKVYRWHATTTVTRYNTASHLVSACVQTERENIKGWNRQVYKHKEWGYVFVCKMHLHVCLRGERILGLVVCRVHLYIYLYAFMEWALAWVQWFLCV